MAITPFNLDESIHSSKARQHHYLYAHKVIADLSLKRNKTFLSMLTNPDSDGFLVNLWNQTAKRVPEAEVIPSDGLKSSPLVKVNDNYLLAIIRFPSAERPTEAIFSGIILHRHSGKVRYIVLEKSFRGVILCEWTADGLHKQLPQDLSIRARNDLSLREFAALLITAFC